MPATANDQFYSRLPVNEIPLSDLFSEEHLFYKIPDNWHIIITDVKKSTIAVASGLHQTVNLVATGSIVAVLNLAYKNDLTIPFFFGGDGATFILPPSILEASLKALLIHQQNTLSSYDLHLRVGAVPVRKVYENEHMLSISKLRTSESFSIPVLLGSGLTYAEQLIKGDDYVLEPPDISDNDLDLSGMQCRWDTIRPPVNNDEVISLLVLARNTREQARVFRNVILKLDEIYGSPERRMPISIPRLKLKGTLTRIVLEMRTKLGGYRPFYLVKTMLTTWLGVLYFRTKPGKIYLKRLVEMSDTLVIDGKINTVISGTTRQRELLEVALQEMESKNEIHFGLHVSADSVMSCYVRNMNDKHVHFVDGSGGGYTMAAGMMKRKFIT